MNTLKSFADAYPSIPTATAWSLTELGEMKGHQDLFTKQSPQKLKALREHAIIESAISSNRIEGVEIDQKRVKAVVLGKSHLRDRNEEEVRNYQKALTWIHTDSSEISVSADTIKKLHQICRGTTWDSGKFKDKDGDIIEKYPNGTSHVRFRTLSAKETPAAIHALAESWNDLVKDQRIPPMVLLAASNLDFLCIHPFRDGNGRVSRLLLLLQLYHLGYEVGRYISLERTIEDNKERYYETLEASSQGWHEGKHDPWPYINYLLFIVKEAYREFEERIGQIKSPKGEKTALILSAINAANESFSLVDIEAACPGVSRDMIRRILWIKQKDGVVECTKRGPGATWRKKM